MQVDFAQFFFYISMMHIKQQSKTALEPYWTNESLSTHVIIATNFDDLIEDFYQTTIGLGRASATAREVSPAGTEIAPEDIIVTKSEAEDLELDGLFN